jgi:hypothetical protein
MSNLPKRKKHACPNKKVNLYLFLKNYIEVQSYFPMEIFM